MKIWTMSAFNNFKITSPTATCVNASMGPDQPAVTDTCATAMTPPKAGAQPEECVRCQHHEKEDLTLTDDISTFITKRNAWFSEITNFINIKIKRQPPGFPSGNVKCQKPIQAKNSISRINISTALDREVW